MQAFLRVFVRKKKGAKSSESDSDWRELADEVDKYNSMSDDGRSECSSEDGIDNNDDPGLEANDPIHMELDREREEADESVIDQCEDSVEQQEFDETDLALEPISVGERCEACVLLSKAMSLSKKVQNSRRYHDALKQKSKEEGVHPLSLMKVIMMHWNSHVMCILQILDLQKVVDRLCSDRSLDLRSFIFSAVEWEIMDQLEDILETFLTATNKVSQVEVALIFEVIPLIDKFTEKFKNIITDTSKHGLLRHAARIALQVLNKYYSFTDHCNVYRISILLNPRFKMYYFTHHKWLQGWIDEATDLLQSVWTMTYKPVPDIVLPQPTPVLALLITGSRPKKTRVDFDIVLDYGHQVSRGPDVLEEYLKSPPLPQEMDPIGYWLKQRKAGEAIGNLSATALAQMALDYISVPATSVDPKHVFSFSGGTITKLRNQLSDDSARSTVMVGLWSNVAGLIPEQEFEAKIKEGWLRGKKRKASVISTDEAPADHIDIST